MEADFTSSRLKDIIQNGIKGNFDLEHLLKFHFTIFQYIYLWSGQIRTINIEKPKPALGGLSIEYSDVNNIESDIVSTLSKGSNSPNTYASIFLLYILGQLLKVFFKPIS